MCPTDENNRFHRSPIYNSKKAGHNPNVHPQEKGDMCGIHANRGLLCSGEKERAPLRPPWRTSPEHFLWDSRYRKVNQPTVMSCEEWLPR